MAPTDLPDDPTRDQFADLLARAIRAAGESAELRYDPDAFTLSTAGEGRHVFHLHNAYQEYGAAPAGRKGELFRRFVRTWFAHHKEVPDSFEDVQPDLLPTVRARAYFALNRLQMQVEGLGELDCPHRVLAGHLGVGLVYDLPESILLLQQHHLDDWGVSFDEALGAAVRNLEEVSREPFDGPAPGVWRSPWRDNHDAARLVLTDVIRAHEVAGDPVVVVANRDTLLLTGSDDDEGLTRVAALAEEALGQPRAVSGRAVRLDGETWLPFLPGPGHPAHARFRELTVRSLGQDYADQAELLRALYEKQGKDVFVASFSAIKEKDTGAVVSYCVWSEGVDSLLPRTDEVAFYRPDAPEGKQVLARVPWETVAEVAGALMKPAGLYPERYRVRKFPGPRQLARLARAQRR
jgi:hypothetical protein